MRDKWILFPVVVIGSITCFEPSDIPSEVQKGFTILICDKFTMTHLRCGQHSGRTGEKMRAKEHMRAKRRTGQSCTGVLKLKETNGLNSLFYEKERVLNYVTVLRLHWAATVATESVNWTRELDQWANRLDLIQKLVHFELQTIRNYFPHDWA